MSDTIDFFAKLRDVQNDMPRQSQTHGSGRRGRRASNLRHALGLNILSLSKGNPDIAVHRIGREYGLISLTTAHGIGGVTFIPWNNGKSRDEL